MLPKHKQTAIQRSLKAGMIKLMRTVLLLLENYATEQQYNEPN